ncbi:thioredoxin [Pontimonas salivibrio]|uniref:Thioredoxin n=1 Tax=Pontimonas salivibrio TaxID=1159327 RepID=A0A2L2BNU5_9MICO|nr:glutaredoxin family protein [Pontimonas salivibrio]AVG23292.1 thioredoxin [Pontimonas salivibrio]
MPVTITLIGKPGCHLCDDARAVIAEVADDALDVEFDEVSLDDNPLWSELYGELIPVVLVNGKELAHWRVDKKELSHAVNTALAEAS